MSESTSLGSVDANILLRWLLGDIPSQQKQVDKLFAKYSALHVSDLALIEVAFILEKFAKFDRELISENIFQVLDHPILKTNHKLFSLALPMYVGHPKLSIVDCCLVVYATLHGAMPLWTFDKKLALQTTAARLLD